MKLTFKSEIIPLLTIAAVIIAAFYFAGVLPEVVPIHWNAQGQVDDYGSKNFAVIFLPLIIIGMYLLFLLLPYIDPRKANYQKFAGAYNVFKTSILLVMLALYLITNLNALGYPLPVNLIVPLIIAVLFIVMGAYLPKIKSNWFVGIRTPWTLSNDEVWQKTHQLGGKLFMAEGLLMIILIFLLPDYLFIFLMISVFALLIWIFVYSYLLYRKVGK